MKLTEVTCREAVYHDGKKSLTTKDAALELHPSGVLIQVKGRIRILVPFSNVLWVGVEAARP